VFHFISEERRMHGRKARETPAELWRAAQRFATWRRGREVGTRIPEPLWQRAIALARRHGLSRTATALGLDYYSLKQRVEAPAPAPVRDSSSRPAFVELAASSLIAAPLGAASLATPGECLIEFANTSGASLRIHLKGQQVPDLVALGRSFWNG
jgi:hypothetical protein